MHVIDHSSSSGKHTVIMWLCGTTPTCRIPNAASDDLDDLVLESEVLHKRPELASAESEACRRSQKMADSIRELLEKFLEELKQK